jgi:hypothetical protein
MKEAAEECGTSLEHVTKAACNMFLTAINDASRRMLTDPEDALSVFAADRKHRGLTLVPNSTPLDCGILKDERSVHRTV